MSDNKDTLILKILHFINPLSRLGERKYSAFLPLTVTLSAVVISEFIVVNILEDTGLSGLIAIFLFLGLTVYFSFRDGVNGGIIAASISILYYLYIVFTRQENPASGFRATILFGILYFLIAFIIGWLRQSIDKLIEKETDDRRRLNVVVQQLPVGVVITNEKGTIELANEKAEEILGVNVPVGYTVDQGFLVDLTQNGKPLQPPRKLLKQLFKKGKPVIADEYEINLTNGKKRYIQISADVIKNKKGKIIATATILSDITDQKEMELRKDDFVNMASHELKTPLTSMKLYIDTLISSIDQSNNVVKRSVRGIKSQVDRLQILVEDLLDVSRLQTGRLSYTKEELVFEELIREIIEVTEATNKHKRIKYFSNSSTKLYADKFRISQVLSNLFTNALKYSPKDTDVIVKTKRSNGKIVISVKDFGIGIEKEQHNKIFGRLYQVADKVEKTFPGLGMGLYISKEIINHHGGDIWVKSKKGKGSTFYFSLPTNKQE